jgi:hypothetical protein
MSLGHGASIVRDGLILQLDADNIKSFPGSLGPELVTNPTLLEQDGSTAKVTDAQSLALCSVEADAYYFIDYGPTTFNSFTAPGLFTVDDTFFTALPTNIATVQWQFRHKIILQATTSGTLRITAAGAGADFDVDKVSVRKILSGDISTWRDLSGSGYNASLQNSANWYSKQFFPGSLDGGAVGFNFDSSYGSYIDCGNIPEISSSLTGFTCSFWLNEYNSSSYTIASNGNTSGFDQTFLISLDSNNKFLFGLGDSNGTDAVVSNTVYNGNSWINAVFTWQTGEPTKIYINGELDAVSQTGSSAVGVADGAQNIRINGSISSSFTFTGAISDFYLYSRGLTEAEVAQNFEATRGRYGI